MEISSDHRIPKDAALVEILTRLPVKSLMRFKCVCKSWLDLIRNPSFARSHLRSQKLRNKARFFLQYFDKDTEQDRYALFPDETLASAEYLDLDFIHTIEYSSSAVVVGPTNGLFCLFNGEDRIIIWNPAMREFRVVPYPYDRCFTPNRHVKASIGFGLDPKNNDYKVVLIRDSRDEITHMPEVCVNVYSLGTDNWRHLDDPSPDQSLPYFRQTGAYADGVYYWRTGNYVAEVVAFDMGDEVFRVIPVPFIRRQGLGKWNLTSYCDDRIAIFGYGFKFAWCEIWVLEAAKGGWIPQFSIGPMPGIAFSPGFWINGVLIFGSPYQTSVNSDSRVLSYNPWTGEIRYLRPKTKISKTMDRTIVYHESLVSVNKGVHQKKGKLSDSIHYFFDYDPRVDFLYELKLFMFVDSYDTYGDRKARRLLSKVKESCEYSTNKSAF